MKCTDGLKLDKPVLRFESYLETCVRNRLNFRVCQLIEAGILHFVDVFGCYFHQIKLNIARYLNFVFGIQKTNSLIGQSKSLKASRKISPQYKDQKPKNISPIFVQTSFTVFHSSSPLIMSISLFNKEISPTSCSILILSSRFSSSTLLNFFIIMRSLSNYRLDYLSVICLTSS